MTELDGSHHVEFTLFCNSDSHPQLEPTLDTFRVLVNSGDAIMLPRISAPFLVDNDVLSDATWSMLRHDYRGKVRSRYRAACNHCATAAESTRSDAAPVVAQYDKLRDIVERLAQHGVTRLSLAGLKVLLSP